jgi:RNA polymerase sigma-70 factor (ECF subfamily)
MGEVETIDVQLSLLMTAAQAGDGESYRVLLTAVTPRIRRIVHARRAVPGAADVEDLAQDVLLSVHSAMATYNPSRPFTPWLLAVMRHRLVDAARRAGRRNRREIAVEDLDVTVGAIAANTGGRVSATCKRWPTQSGPFLPVSASATTINVAADAPTPAIDAAANARTTNSSIPRVSVVPATDST